MVATRARKQNSESIAVFKIKLPSFIRPSKIPLFNVNDPEGVNT